MLYHWVYLPRVTHNIVKFCAAPARAPIASLNNKDTKDHALRYLLPIRKVIIEMINTTLRPKMLASWAWWQFLEMQNRMRGNVVQHYYLSKK